MKQTVSIIAVVTGCRVKRRKLTSETEPARQPHFHHKSQNLSTFKLLVFCLYFPISVLEVTNRCRDGRFGSKVGQDWTPNWTNPGLFQIRFQYIWLDEPNILKCDLKRSRICPTWGPIWPTLEPSLPSLKWCEICAAWETTDLTEFGMSCWLLIWADWHQKGTNLSLFSDLLEGTFWFGRQSRNSVTSL